MCSDKVQTGPLFWCHFTQIYSQMTVNYSQIFTQIYSQKHDEIHKYFYNLIDFYTN